MAQLLGKNGRDARKAAVESFKDRLGSGGQRLLKGLGIRGQGVQLLLGLGYKILLARKHFPDGADGGRNSFDAVNNHIIFVKEYDVAVLSHDLYYQGLGAQIAHLIQMLHLNVHDPFQSGLRDFRNAPVLKMLAQKHAEAGGGHGAGLCALCQINQGKRSVGGEQKPPLAVRLFYGQQQLVCLRLGDLIEPSSR